MAGADAIRARTGLVLLAAACLPALAVATALAASSPVHGATYRGALTGARSKIKVSFRVSSSGAAVTTIRVSALPLFCPGQPPPAAKISFGSAKVGARGTFTASGADTIGVGPLKGSVIAKLKLTGTFGASASESGVLSTTFAGNTSCDGHASYRTKA